MYLLRYILSICLFLPLILGLFLIATKLSATQYNNINKKKYMRVLEKTMISKDVYSVVIKMGDTAHAGILTNNGFNPIKQLNSLEIAELDNSVNKTVVTTNQVHQNSYSFDMAKPYIESIIKKIKGLLNKISKERY